MQKTDTHSFSSPGSKAMEQWDRSSNLYGPAMHKIQRTKRQEPGANVVSSPGMISSAQGLAMQIKNAKIYPAIPSKPIRQPVDTRDWADPTIISRLGRSKKSNHPAAISASELAPAKPVMKYRRMAGLAPCPSCAKKYMIGVPQVSPTIPKKISNPPHHILGRLTSCAARFLRGT
jgi:hypothetical protein